jgi:membrane protein
MIFRVLPDAQIAWRDTWIGAAITTSLFALGKQVIGAYLGRASVGLAYGAAGSLVVLLVWVYYSTLILLLGAEFTHSYSTLRGQATIPEPHAVKDEDSAGVQPSQGRSRRRDRFSPARPPSGGGGRKETLAS